jgi:outer membrane protein OmpA-like peptidoglycan-associated protein
MKYFSAVIIAFSFVFSIKGQEQLPDCTNPQEVKLSVYNTFSKNDSLESIYYQEEDTYTFWYKLTVDGDGEIKYTLQKLNSDDEYEVVYYEYNGNNFCNDLMQQKVKPKSGSVFKVHPDYSYYISVLHISGKGCGHQMKFSSIFHTKHYSAIQNTCVEEIAEEIQKYDLSPVIPRWINTLTWNKNQSNITLKHTPNKLQPIKNSESEQTSITILGSVINAKTKLPIAVDVQLVLSDSSFSLLNHSEHGFSITAQNQEHKVVIKIDKLGYKSFQENFVIKHDTNLVLLLSPIAVGEKIVSHNIYFQPNTPVLKDKSKAELEKIKQFLKENDNITIEIQGHTNGNRRIKKDRKFAHLNGEWNFSGTAKELSQLRAEKVKKYLEENGVNPNQMTAKGYGGDKMIVDNPKNMKEAMKNIRVEIVVIKQLK